MHLFKKAMGVALAGGLSLAAAPAAEAAVILTFGQANDGPTITATAAAGVTTITGTNVAVVVSQIDAGVATPFNAFFNLSAVSTNAATDVGGNVFQNFQGEFTITSGANGTGVNYLSGIFIDSVFGQGASLTMSASSPPGTVEFTSDVITTLAQTRALAFGFADVTPAAFIEDETIGSFRSSVAGTLSADRSVPEPATMSLLGLGLVGAAFAARRRR